MGMSKIKAEHLLVKNSDFHLNSREQNWTIVDMFNSLIVIENYHSLAFVCRSKKLSKLYSVMGGSPGLVVKGGDS